MWQNFQTIDFFLTNFFKKFNLKTAIVSGYGRIGIFPENANGGY